MNAEAEAMRVKQQLLDEHFGNVDHALSHACRTIVFLGEDSARSYSDQSAGYVRRPPPAPVRPGKPVPKALDIPSEQAP